MTLDGALGSAQLSHVRCIQQDLCWDGNDNKRRPGVLTQDNERARGKIDVVQRHRRSSFRTALVTDLWSWSSAAMREFEIGGMNQFGAKSVRLVWMMHLSMSKFRPDATIGRNFHATKRSEAESASTSSIPHSSRLTNCLLSSNNRRDPRTNRSGFPSMKQKINVQGLNCNAMTKRVTLQSRRKFAGSATWSLQLPIVRICYSVSVSFPGGWTAGYVLQRLRVYAMNIFALRKA